MLFGAKRRKKNFAFFLVVRSFSPPCNGWNEAFGCRARRIVKNYATNCLISKWRVAFPQNAMASHIAMPLEKWRSEIGGTICGFQVGSLKFEA